jgi:hypothetical protein
MHRFALAILVLAAGTAVRGDDAASLLERWVTAVGGSERIASVDVIHRVGEASDDGTRGTRDEWVTRALARRELVEHGHDQSLSVYDRKVAWQRDWNGFVAPLDGYDVKREQALALLHGFGLLTGAAGAPELVSENTLRFQPAGGLPLTVVLDPVTALPARAELPSFDGTLTITFTDWREVDGLHVAFSETSTTGPSKSELHLMSVELHPSQPVSFTRPESGPSDASFLRDQRRQVVPFNFDNNHIMILATVNGVGPIWFLVDTGADHNYLNQSRMAELHLQSYGALQTIGGGEQSTGGSYAEHVTIRIGDVELRNQHAGVLELRGLEKLYGMPMGGLLGFDFLSRFVVDIDYAHRQLVLYDRAHDTSKEPGARVHLVMQGQQPYLDGSIRVGDETIKSWFILDVGAADTMTFTTPFIAAHQLLDRAGDKARNVLHVAAPDVEAYAPTNVRGLVDAITLGSISVPHVPVNFSVAKNGAYTSPAFDGNVGETLLSRFHDVILDYGRGEMILEPGPDTTQPMHERTTFGLTIIASGDAYHTFNITAVGKDSPAVRAGFQQGDVITAVDDTPATKLTLALLRSYFAAAGPQHTVTVHRGADEVKLTVTVEVMPLSGLK